MHTYATPQKKAANTTVTTGKASTTNPLQLKGCNCNPLQAKTHASDPSQAYEDLEKPWGSNAFQLKVNKAAAPPPIQQSVKKNNTGLPDNLKAGVENLSGFSMDDVKVHYNSDKPAQLQALAYAQGTDIHVAPGQQQHLPHEVWHVVQQKQGRVQPTMQMKGGANVNDDARLEKEADVVYDNLKQARNNGKQESQTGIKSQELPVLQRVIQRTKGGKAKNAEPQNSGSDKEEVEKEIWLKNRGTDTRGDNEKDKGQATFKEENSTFYLTSKLGLPELKDILKDFQHLDLTEEKVQTGAGNKKFQDTKDEPEPTIDRSLQAATLAARLGSKSTMNKNVIMNCSQGKTRTPVVMIAYYILRGDNIKQAVTKVAEGYNKDRLGIAIDSNGNLTGEPITVKKSVQGEIDKNVTSENTTVGADKYEPMADGKMNDGQMNILKNPHEMEFFKKIDQLAQTLDYKTINKEGKTEINWGKLETLLLEKVQSKPKKGRNKKKKPVSKEGLPTDLLAPDNRAEGVEDQMEQSNLETRSSEIETSTYLVNNRSGDISNDVNMDESDITESTEELESDEDFMLTDESSSEEESEGEEESLDDTTDLGNYWGKDAMKN